MNICFINIGFVNSGAGLTGAFSVTDPRRPMIDL
ncbi:hypothetical protein [Brenneria rubrifaciens]